MKSQSITSDMLSLTEENGVKVHELYV